MINKTNVEGKKLNLKYVSNVIGDEYKKWRAGDIVLIDAQTGTGKNYFIEEVLLPYVDEDEEVFGYAKRILYLSNRTNLKREVKQRLLKKYHMATPSGLKVLDNITTIGNITISSYHALQQSGLEQIYDNKKSSIHSYDYIICDEAHFTLTDGGFNRLNRLTLDKIVLNYYPNAIKIFLSATMEEIENPIKKSLDKLIGKKPNIHEYSTGRDYSYLNVKYFRHMNRINILSNLIKNDTSSDKWMIFISAKEDGNKLIDELGEETCSMIYASMEETPELNSIITKNEFEKKVLICTKALDNGVNIKDPNVKNIVVMALDKTSMIQMIGRKRIKIENAQEVNLYLSTRSKKTFITLINGYNPQLKQVELLGKDKMAFMKKYDNYLDKINADIIYHDPKTGDFKVNPTAYARLIKDNAFAIEMVGFFNFDKDFAFIRTQLRWLGLTNTFNENNLIEGVISDSEKETFEEYIKKLIPIKILEEEQVKLKEMLTSEAFKIDRKLLQGTKKMHPDTFNSIMEKTLQLPYKVVATRTSKRVDGKIKKYTYWTIVPTKLIS